MTDDFDARNISLTLKDELNKLCSSKDNRAAQYYTLTQNTSLKDALVVFSAFTDLLNLCLCYLKHMLLYIKAPICLD